MFRSFSYNICCIIYAGCTCRTVGSMSHKLSPWKPEQNENEICLNRTNWCKLIVSWKTILAAISCWDRYHWKWGRELTCIELTKLKCKVQIHHHVIQVVWGSTCRFCAKFKLLWFVAAIWINWSDWREQISNNLLSYKYFLPCLNTILPVITSCLSRRCTICITNAGHLFLQTYGKAHIKHIFTVSLLISVVFFPVTWLQILTDL